MSKIQAPYNFIPYTNTVVLPTWSKDVSHDSPFEDGESGEIDVKITAISHIFVSNGLSRKESDVDGSSILFFSQNAKNKYFIPATSLKGAIRSVFEVFTFSKMKKVQNSRYSLRDFNDSDYGDFMRDHKFIHCGWLRKRDGDCFLQDCGRPGRIPQGWIDDRFRTNLKMTYLNTTILNKSAKYKYDLVKDPDIFEKEFFFKSGRHFGGQNFFAGDREIFDLTDDNNSRKGRIVFTGQAGPRIENPRTKPKGKILEFIFFEHNEKEIKISSDVMSNFFFAMYDHDKHNQSDDWKWRKRQLEEGEKIPVFFRLDDKGKVIDMGLSYMYKIVYQNSINDLLGDNHKSDDMDFSQTVFGYTSKESSLKSRVNISNAFNINNSKADSVHRLVLMGPKASYHPNYVRQNGGVYKTYMHNDAILSGRKRYPIHKSGIKRSASNDTNEKITTEIRPLMPGAIFSSKIRFHNLRKIEIGALLSSLSFHHTSNCYYNIGMGKPLGYGKTRVDIAKIKGLKHSEKDYLRAFESYMINEIPNWASSTQIDELLAMSSEQNNNDDSTLEYLETPKEFVDAKVSNLFLKKYSSLKGVSRISLSLLSSVDERSLINRENIIPDLKNMKSELYNKRKGLKDEIQKLIDNTNDQIQREKITKDKKLNLEKARETTNLDFSSIDFDNKKVYNSIVYVIEQYLAKVKILKEEDKELALNIFVNAFNSEKFKSDKKRTKKYNVYKNKINDLQINIKKFNDKINK